MTRSALLSAPLSFLVVALAAVFLRPVNPTDAANAVEAGAPVVLTGPAVETPPSPDALAQEANVPPR